MRNQYLIETLAGIEFLRGLSDSQLEQLAKLARVVNFDASETIFPEGAVADGVYLVVSGSVSLEICAPAIGCKRIQAVGPGEILGWSGLLERPQFTATARAILPTQVVRFDSAPLVELCRDDPALGGELLRRALVAVAERLRVTRVQLLERSGAELPAAPRPEESPAHCLPNGTPTG
jgi:CRP-like cAMP-binding protein